MRAFEFVRECARERSFLFVMFAKQIAGQITKDKMWLLSLSFFVLFCLLFFVAGVHLHQNGKYTENNYAQETGKTSMALHRMLH